MIVLVRYPEDPEPIIADGTWHGTIVDAGETIVRIEELDEAATGLEQIDEGGQRRERDS